MNLFVLVDATGAYWWLRKGGFGRIDAGLQPLTFRSREEASQKAENLRQSYGFDLRPEPLRTPGKKR